MVASPPGMSTTVPGRGYRLPPVKLTTDLYSRFDTRVRTAFDEGVEKGAVATGEMRLGRKAPPPHPCQFSWCSSGTTERTAPHLFFYTLFDCIAPESEHDTIGE